MVPDRVTVGRAPTNSIQLEDETVSSLHAEIVSKGGGKYLVRDLGSKNGTFVDGVAVAEGEMSGPCKIAFGAVEFEVQASEGAGDAPAGTGSGIAPLVSENREQAALVRALEEVKSSHKLESDSLAKEISDLKSAHALQIDRERLEHAEQIARIERLSEERLQGVQGEAEALAGEIEGLKQAHNGELETIRRETAAQMASLESQRESASKEQNEKRDSLAAEIADLKSAHASQIENERREQERKLGEIERDAAERLGNLEERCEALARGVEEIKAADEAQIASERAAHAAEIRASEARVDAKKEECVALARQIEALKGALESKIEDERKAQTASTQPRYSSNQHPERGVIAPPSDHGSLGRQVKISLPIGKFASLIRRKLSNRTEIGASLGALLWVGFMGSGLYLIKPSAPSGPNERTSSLTSILSSEKPGTASSKEHEVKTQVSPASVVNSSASLTASLPPLNGSEEKAINSERKNSSNLATAKTDGGAPALSGSGPETAPDFGIAKKGDTVKVADAAKGSDASEDAGGLCPCAGGETVEAPKPEAASIPAIAEGPAPADKEAVQNKSVAQETADAPLGEQNLDVDAEKSTSGFQRVGFRLQRQESPPSGNESSASNSTVEKSDKPDKPVNPLPESDKSEGAAPVKSKDLRRRDLKSPDLAKNEPPASLSNALRRKDGPDKGAPKSAEGLRVLILGDSLSLCGFGKRLDSKFRAEPQVQAVYTYMACGVNPLSWIKEKPYANVKTHCGFWSIESTAGQPKDMEDVYGMKPGSVPKPHPVPKVEELLEATHPDILVMQCGTNLFELFANRTTPDSNKDGPLVRKYIAPFFNAVRKCQSLRKIYWVSPPTSGRTSNEIQEFVFSQTRACSGDLATVIDSRSLVTYPYHMMEPDHEHFLGTDMTQWADRVFSLVKQDYSSKPFDSFPMIAGMEMPVTAKAPPKSETPASAAPLAIKAKLSFKSPPIPIKELLPYQESLVGFVYDVDQVVAGKYEEKQILVLHPACIGLKPQPLEKYKMGKVYNLRLSELEATPWHTVKSQDQSGRIDLIPYIQVEDEKKYPGNSR